MIFRVFEQKNMWIREASVPLTVVKDSMGVRYFAQEILGGDFGRRLCASQKTTQNRSLRDGSKTMTGGGGVIYLGRAEILHTNSRVVSEILHK